MSAVQYRPLVEDGFGFLINLFVYYIPTILDHLSRYPSQSRPLTVIFGVQTWCIWPNQPKKKN